MKLKNISIIVLLLCSIAMVSATEQDEYCIGTSPYICALYNMIQAQCNTCVCSSTGGGGMTEERMGDKLMGDPWFFVGMDKDGALKDWIKENYYNKTEIDGFRDDIARIIQSKHE